MSASAARSISSAQLTIDSSMPVGMPGCPPEMPAKESLSFGKTFSPHMLRCHYVKDGGGWQSPEIVPFQNIHLSPAASSLHYGLQCFEGMKAYKTLDDEDDIRLFRPDMNMRRLKDSMARLAKPGADFDSQELIDCIGKLVRLGEDRLHPMRPTGLRLRFQ